MMNCNNWDKCAVVINRLSSRIANEQNQSAMMENCSTTIPLCIEKSFYQCKNNVGQGCCVQVCGDCSDPIKLSGGIGKNANISKCGMITADDNLNQHLVNMGLDSSRHQLALSKMFDNKRKYIDYVVTNVLRQVVNHISIDSLHQLSCCLPENIEDILCNVTDIDSDRLVRILVTEVLQCYGTNAEQLTDWYIFANSIKPFILPTKAKDDDIENADRTENKISSKQKKSSNNEKSSERVLKNHIGSIFGTTPVINKEQSLESTATSKAFISSINETPSTGTTPYADSTMTPLSTHSKETFTPIGTKYQTRAKPNQHFISDEPDKIEHEFFSFRENSTNRPQAQHQISSDAPHYEHTSNKSSDLSSCSDCVLTIRHKHHGHKHKHKHKRAYHHHHTTTSFDTPSSENDRKYKQMSVDTSSMITHPIPTRPKSRQHNSSNSANAEEVEQSTSSDSLADKQLASSDNITNHLHPIANPTFQQLSLTDAAISFANNEYHIAHFVNEVEQSTSDNKQLQLSKKSNMTNLSSNTTDQLNKSIDSNINSIPLEKKSVRINHYPNMLADFD